MYYMWPMKLILLTSILMTFAHHHAAQDYQCGSTEAELLSAKQCHEDYVATALQLAVNLQSHLASQTVLDESLLGLGNTYLWGYSCKAHARCRACARSALRTRDNYQVSFSLGYSCGDGAHTALGNKLYADGGLGVDVLKVEDELCEILDGVNVVVGWW